MFFKFIISYLKIVLLFKIIVFIQQSVFTEKFRHIYKLYIIAISNIAYNENDIT